MSNLGASDDNDEVKANVRERTRYLVWVGVIARHSGARLCGRCGVLAVPCYIT